ncbi:hypothetical protein O3P69_006455 [Scylla paramamosain]|uniref:Uncharacterized protein n=1 Tax=Scylla paramamosain TaxID=85552 RepID=A0AAW0U2H0_SCYPA
MAQLGDNFTPRVCRQLAFISEFTTDIKHVRGEENPVADDLSRGDTRSGDGVLPRSVATVSCPPPVDYAAVAAAQEGDQELQALREGPTPLQMLRCHVPDSPSQLWCDVSCGVARPYIPQFRRRVFTHYHALNHPGILGTHRLIHAIPMPDSTAETTATHFLSRVCGRCLLACTPPAPHFPAELQTTTSVFLRTDAVTSPLQPPYTGPYQVLDRGDKHVTLDVHGRHYVTSWDKVKAARLPPDHDPHQLSPASKPRPAAPLGPALRLPHPRLVGLPLLRRPEGADRDRTQGQESSGASQVPTAPPSLPETNQGHLPLLAPASLEEGFRARMEGLVTRAGRVVHAHNFSKHLNPILSE